MTTKFDYDHTASWLGNLGTLLVNVLFFPFSHENILILMMFLKNNFNIKKLSYSVIILYGQLNKSTINGTNITQFHGNRHEFPIFIRLNKKRNN